MGKASFGGGYRCVTTPICFVQVFGKARFSKAKRDEAIRTGARAQNEAVCEVIISIGQRKLHSCRTRGATGVINSICGLANSATSLSIQSSSISVV